MRIYPVLFKARIDINTLTVIPGRILVIKRTTNIDEQLPDQ